MIDKTLEQEIIQFIQKQALSVEYGKIHFTINVIQHNVVDMNGERVEEHIKFKRDKK